MVMDTEKLLSNSKRRPAFLDRYCLPVRLSVVVLDCSDCLSLLLTLLNIRHGFGTVSFFSGLCVAFRLLFSYHSLSDLTCLSDSLFSIFSTSAHFL